jgi:hypothetical protein
MFKRTKALLFAVIVLLCACAKSDDADRTKDIDVSETKFASLEEIRNNLETTLQKQTDNLILPNFALIPESDTVEMLEILTLNINLEKDYEDILKWYFNLDDINSEFLRDLGYGYIDYIDENTGYRAVVSSFQNGGVLSMGKDEHWSLKISNGYKVYEVIHIDRNDDLNKSYKLKNGECVVADAVDFAEAWVNDFWKKYEPELEFRAKIMIVREAPEELGEFYTFEIFFEKLYNGVPLDELGQDLSREENERFAALYMHLKMIESNDIFLFGNHYSVVFETVDVLTEIISLDFAIDAASNYMAGYNKLKIDSISLKYAFYGGTYLNNDNFEIIPVWSFEMDNSPLSEKRKSVYVNALTGEVYYEMRVAN